MQLQQLRYLITTAECGSVRAAAQKLYLSQSSLSVAIRDLERELGITIFQRTSRGVSPTDEGLEAISYARQIVDQADLMLSRFAENGESEVRFAVSSQHYEVVVEAFGDLLDAHAERACHLTLSETSTIQVIRDVHDHRSSVGVIYLNDYNEHVELAKKLDKENRLPATFMVVSPGSWNDEVWDDIVRMRTLNTAQSLKGKQLHVCPLQLDIVDRLINRYSNPGETVYDPFGGLMTVPVEAVKMGRFGIGTELNADYFRDGVGYLEEADHEREAPTLFDFLEDESNGTNR